MQLSFPQQRVRMVRTRSRATSPSRQASRGASSDPQRDRQSAPAMQTSSVQHVQSMAAAMVKLTRQNQELRMEINQRKRHVRNMKEEDKHKVMVIEKTLKLEVSSEALLHGQ